VRDLVAANSQRDLQHLQAADLLAERRIEARSTLFDKSKVKSGHVRDRLDMVVAGKS
jgi:hypothetical protein